MLWYFSDPFWVCKLWHVQSLNWVIFWVIGLSSLTVSVGQQTRRHTVICVFKPQFQRKECSRTMDSLEATGTSIRPGSGPAAASLHHHPALFIESESAPDPVLIIIGRRYTKGIIVTTTITMKFCYNQRMQSKPLSKTKWTHWRGESVQGQEGG